MGVANMLMTGTSTVFSLFVTGAVFDRVVHFHRLTFASCVLMAFLVLCYTWAESATTIILLSAVQGMCLGMVNAFSAGLRYFPSPYLPTPPNPFIHPPIGSR